MCILLLLIIIDVNYSKCLFPFKMKITMLSTSKRKTAVRRGSEQLSERRYFKRIPTPVMANCRRAVTPDVWPSTKHKSVFHINVISTIIVLIILSITKSYSALPTDVSTTVVSLLQPTTNSTVVNLVYQTDQHSAGNDNISSSNFENLWAKSANETSDSVVDGKHVDNSSVSYTVPSQTASRPTAPVIDNPLQINESSWSINNSAKSTGGDHWHRQQHSDLISHLHCEYGTIRKYSFSSVVQSRLTSNGSTRATVLVRCLDQVTWGVGDQQDRLNGQKYIVYISDFHSGASDDSKIRSKRMSFKERSKRSIYQTFEHLWSDIRSILPNFEEDTSSSHHDDFDQDLLKSMESELRSKCHSFLFWEKNQRPDKCIHCRANPSSKFSLPFWFIQLEDGTIPQVRFTKQEVNLDVKNFKKLIISLLATQLNSSSYDSVEKSVLGLHRSHYFPLNFTNHSEKQPETSISTAHIQPLIIERHIEPTDFLFEQNKELPISSDSFPLNITATFTQHIDNELKQIISSHGQVTTAFGPSDLSLYCTTIHEYQLEKEKVFNRKMGDVLNELQERYTESQKESLIGEASKEETLLQEKYSDLLYRLRAQLGRNEYHYYTKLFDAATNKAEETEYDSLLRLVGLEQQLNHSMHQHNSLIGDLRRIGTIHNIQLVCGLTLVRLTDSDTCAAFLYLLLQSSSKTAQHVLLYSMQNQSGGEPSAKATMAARLLAQTYRPSRWLIENLAHEAHHQVNNRPMETILLQTLTQIAQREQLVKLKELLISHLLKRIKETLADVEPSPASTSVTISELYTIDLLEMLGNLGNYTALQSVQEGLKLKWHSSDLVTIATIHAYRRSINRSQVQNQLSALFLSANSCQIKQHIVQLLIDDVDLMFWLPTKDKRWPKYGFEPLDQVLADELRNSSTNCVHHLIIEYFKRKVNSKASKLVGEFKASHNVTASSFDFCITEASNYKCDYVQVLGNELASVEMQKSISISKPFQATFLLNGSSSAWPQSTYIYAEHSLSTVISKYKLTVAHLSLIQIKSSEGKSRLRVQLQTPTGNTIPLANVPLHGSHLQHQQQQQQAANASAVKIAQMKLTVPVRVAASEHSPQANNALLVSIEAYFAVYLQTNWQHTAPDSKLSEGTLRIQISLKSTGEFAYSGLALQRSIDLQCKFEYESKQPVEIWQTTRQSVIVKNVSTEGKQARRTMTTTSTTSENEAIRLGNEAFAGQVQLWQHSNKQYDAQCNIWTEQSERQQLSHWNSTVKQSNFFALPLQQPLPQLTTALTANVVATNQPANASVVVVDEAANTARKTTT